MEKAVPLIDKIYGDIFLKKTYLFGFIKYKIRITALSNDKIVDVYFKPLKLQEKLNIKLGHKLDYKKIIEWSEDNGYEITFSAKSGLLRRKYLLLFGDKLVF